MGKFSHILNNFISGEVSPKLYGRTDSETYKTSSKEIRNMIVHPQGGVSRRVGTQHIPQKVLTDDGAPNVHTSPGLNARLIPFIYSKTEKYLITITPNTTVLEPTIEFYNVDDETHFREYTSGSAFAGFNMPNSSASPYNYVRGTTNPPSKDPNFTNELQYTQKGNLLIITHPRTPPLLIRREGINSFTASYWYNKEAFSTATTAGDFANSMPYRENINPKHTMTLSGTLTVGANPTLLSSQAFFDDGHLLSFIALKSSNGASLGYAQITTVTTNVLVTLTVVQAGITGPKDLVGVGTTATGNWAESYWSEYRGWPSSCTFAEGRLVFGGSPSYPDAVWFTQTDDINEWSNDKVLDPGSSIIESDPGILFPATREVNEITWLNGGNRNVLVGTRGAEYSISRLSGLPLDTSSGEVITKYAMQSSHGSEYLQPVSVDEATIYLQRGARKIRNMVFDNRIEAYKSKDITFLAEHITRRSSEGGLNLSKITQMVYQELDNKTLWAMDNNGKLIYATLDSESSVVAWAHVDLGGTSPNVQSVCSLPSKNGTTDEVYILVARTIDGTTKIYLEKLGNDFLRDSLAVDSDLRENAPIFIDSAKVFRTNPNATWWGEYSANDELVTGVDTLVTGTLVGSQSFANKAMTLTSGSYITYATSPISGLANFCIKMHIALAAKNVPQSLFTSYDSSAASNKDRVEIVLEATSTITLRIYEGNVGVVISTVSVPVPSNLEGMDLFIEANVDGTNGIHSLTVNGITVSQVGSLSRFTNDDQILIGAGPAGAQANLGATIKDLQIFNSAQTIRGEIYEYQPATDRLGIDSKTFTQLDYLEGEIVQVVADGNYLGDFTVSDGAVTVGSTPPIGGWKTVIVGLSYRHLISPNEIEAGGNLGNSQGEIKRIDKLVGRFNKTAQCSYGDSEANQSPIVFRDADAPMGDPIGLYTGDKILEFDGDITRNPAIVLSGDAPLPCNITCIIVKGITYG